MALLIRKATPDDLEALGRLGAMLMRTHGSGSEARPASPSGPRPGISRHTPSSGVSASATR